MNRRSFLEKAGLSTAAFLQLHRAGANAQRGISAGAAHQAGTAKPLNALNLPLAGMKRRKKPNIVLIMADDLGYECIGANGSESYRTPYLDRLAEKGMRFTHCYAQPLCTPSRVQLMTGKYNFRNYKMFGYLDIGEITFAHLLKKAEYTTCISGKWQLSNGIEGPFHAGFDEYCLWQIYARIAGEDARGPRYADPKIHVNGRLLENTKGKYGPDIYCEYIETFMEKNRDKPFFVYYPMALTHDPYCPTPDSADWGKDRNASGIEYFADNVAYMDKIVGRLHDKIRSLGLEENTLILFTGDNGTGRAVRSRINGEWIEGGKSLMTDAGTHVPLIASWKGKIQEGVVCDDLIDFTDFLPTFMEAAELKPPDNLVLDGRSFLPRLTGRGGPAREWVYSYYWGNGRDVFKARQSARDRKWKIYDDGSFFNVENDPLEEKLLKSEGLDAAALEARKKLKAVIDGMKAGRS